MTLVPPDQFSEGQEATFRHPLPPGNMARPRMPVPVQQVVVRAPIRQIVDPRMQGVRLKLLQILFEVSWKNVCLLFFF